MQAPFAPRCEAQSEEASVASGESAASASPPPVCISIYRSQRVVEIEHTSLKNNYRAGARDRVLSSHLSSSMCDLLILLIIIIIRLGSGTHL